MCDEEVMSLIAEKLGSDLIVIPSSIHETIILKETENVSVTELNAMVEAVNEEAVTPQEKLGNSVYRFDRTIVLEDGTDIECDRIVEIRGI